jgi:hypothetical protein
MNTSIYIHVGYPKAASTSLQENLFPCHPEIQDLSIRKIQTNQNFNDELFNLKWFYKLLTYINEIEYYYYNNHSQLKQIKHLFKKDKVLISNENFLIQDIDNAIIAERLSDLFPKAKIIFIIRNQFDIILSLANFLSIKDLNNWINRAQQSKSRKLLSTFNYMATISYYEQLFGKNNVGVFLFEDLTQSLNQFAKEISDFMNIDYSITQECLQQPPQNTNSSKKNEWKRIRSYFFPNVKLSKFAPEFVYFPIKNKILNLVSSGVLKTNKLKTSNFFKKIVQDYYAESNFQLMEERHLNLEKYNYPLL